MTFKGRLGGAPSIEHRMGTQVVIPIDVIEDVALLHGQAIENLEIGTDVELLPGLDGVRLEQMFRCLEVTGEGCHSLYRTPPADGGRSHRRAASGGEEGQE
jgi:hypothetical protein